MKLNLVDDKKIKEKEHFIDLFDKNDGD